jgi:ABC-type bacteriocin/lantibiotic exporter with double-glycine peptidase domain
MSGPHHQRRQRIPVILQMTSVDRGATCLAMVLHSHGKDASLRSCRERLSIGRDGVSARTIARAARSLGLVVRSFAAAPDAVEQLPMPAIARWDRDHFVVLERVCRRAVRIVDPALGRRSLTLDEFAGGLSGPVLTFEPANNFGRTPGGPSNGRGEVHPRP